MKIENGVGTWKKTKPDKNVVDEMDVVYMCGWVYKKNKHKI